MVDIKRNYENCQYCQYCLKVEAVKIRILLQLPTFKNKAIAFMCQIPPPFFFSSEPI